jgi:preprotein translocase subunit YajC
MLAALDRNAEVVTTGGILGKVVDFDENFVKIEVSDNNFLQVQRHAIASLMPKGTYKTLNNKKPKV